jgi:CheY-like chemotaxis protein
MYQPILYAEDDENDAFFMERALRDAGIRNRLHIVQDGREAIDYLMGAGEFADREKFPLPAMVVLDLKLPMISGLEVLRELRAHGGPEYLRVVVLVSSRDDKNIQQALDLGANAYVVKPPTGESLRKIIQDFGDEGFDLLPAAERREATLTRQSR